jgi:hypothetical protein
MLTRIARRLAGIEVGWCFYTYSMHSHTTSTSRCCAVLILIVVRHHRRVASALMPLEATLLRLRLARFGAGTGARARARRLLRPLCTAATRFGLLARPATTWFLNGVLQPAEEPSRVPRVRVLRPSQRLILPPIGKHASSRDAASCASFPCGRFGLTFPSRVFFVTIIPKKNAVIHKK